jgi:hypothetical protein
MIVDLTLRLLYLSFRAGARARPAAGPHVLPRRMSSCSCCGMRSPCSAAPTPDRAWTGRTERSSPALVRSLPRALHRLRPVTPDTSCAGTANSWDPSKQPGERRRRAPQGANPLLRNGLRVAAPGVRHPSAPADDSAAGGVARPAERVRPHSARPTLGHLRRAHTRHHVASRQGDDPRSWPPRPPRRRRHRFHESTRGRSSTRRSAADLHVLDTVQGKTAAARTGPSAANVLRTAW